MLNQCFHCDWSKLWPSGRIVCKWCVLAYFIVTKLVKYFLRSIAVVCPSLFLILTAGYSVREAVFPRQSRPTQNRDTEHPWGVYWGNISPQFPDTMKNVATLSRVWSKSLKILVNLFEVFLNVANPMWWCPTKPYNIKTP